MKILWHVDMYSLLLLIFKPHMPLKQFSIILKLILLGFVGQDGNHLNDI